MPGERPEHRPDSAHALRLAITALPITAAWDEVAADSWWTDHVTGRERRVQIACDRSTITVDLTQRVFDYAGVSPA